MLVLHGYIDDSGKENIFVLSCLQADIGMWAFVEMAWLQMLEKVNARLKALGRKQLSRYHASDCQNLKREFKDWTKDEQIELSKMVVKIFKDHKFNTNGYSIDLKQLVEEIPETSPNPKGFAYVFLLHMLMLEMCGGVLTKFKDAIIGLTHDRCDYDAALLEAFNQMMEDPNFKCRNRFTGIVPGYWQHCIPLQPADLLAYENYKEALRRKEMSRRTRRATLKLILNAEPKCIGGNLKCVGRKSLQFFKTILDEMNEETRDILLRTARIRTVRSNNASIDECVPRRNKAEPDAEKPRNKQSGRLRRNLPLDHGDGDKTD